MPSGRVSSEESCRAVSVTFSKSMVPLSPSSEEFDGSSYLSIEPAVKGKFRWKGTSTLVFIPDSPLAAGTRYKASVKAGIKSVYGDALEKGHEWTMEIMPPAVKELFPDSEHALCFPSEGRAVISFNQKIDPEKAKGFVKLFKTDGKSSSEVSAEVRKTVKDDLSVSDLKRADIDKCITVTPSSPLAKGGEYRLDVCKGFPAGDLEMNETRSFVLRSENNFDFLPFSG
ncbi:MAG: Ig-like domain-containing protein, partial [bacterium]|nr:Ig-like domain-containing protein [bacterium]